MPRPKNTLLGKAIVLLRACGFSGIETSELLHTDRRNQERVYKRDLKVYFPEFIETIKVIEKYLENK